MLSISDLVVSCTLLLNAGAILNFSIQKGADFGEPGLRERINDVFSKLRVLRIFIAVWNFIVIMLMLTLFGNS